MFPRLVALSLFCISRGCFPRGICPARNVLSIEFDLLLHLRGPTMSTLLVLLAIPSVEEALWVSCLLPRLLALCVLLETIFPLELRGKTLCTWVYCPTESWGALLVGPCSYSDNSDVRFQNNGVLLKQEKCEFYTKTNTYLGLIISPHCFNMDPADVKAV